MKQGGSRAAAELVERMHQAARERPPKLYKQAWPTHVDHANERQWGASLRRTLACCASVAGVPSSYSTPLRREEARAKGRMRFEVPPLNSWRSTDTGGRRTGASSARGPPKWGRPQPAPSLAGRKAQQEEAAMLQLAPHPSLSILGMAAAEPQLFKSSAKACRHPSPVVEHLGHGDGAAGEVGVVVQALAHLHI